ncbi:5'-3' DNA helicase ZGRF1-like N-terminal domain-containing protein [Entamoeba marina]
MADEYGFKYKVLYTHNINAKTKKNMYDGYAIFKPKYRRFELYKMKDNGEIGGMLTCETVANQDIDFEEGVKLSEYHVIDFEDEEEVNQETKQEEDVSNQKVQPKPARTGRLLKRTNTVERKPKKHGDLLQKKSLIEKRVSNQLQRKRSVEEILDLLE